MKEQHKQSPKQYIETRARVLPIYKCWVNPEWQAAGIANVIVSRRHISGNITAGIYLVDLMCLGIKDTFYFFNETQEDLSEQLNLSSGFFIEIDYNLAHNIVYAGHDFAKEYGIHPHKEFAITKFILDEDTDDIPVVDVHVGDEEGKPGLIVSSDYNYRPVLEKLKKNAGEGNYSFILSDFDEDEDDDDDDDLEDESTLDEIEPDYLDFPDVAEVSDEELSEAMESDFRSDGDKRIIHVEQMIRLKEETGDGWMPFDEEVRETEDFALLLEKNELYRKVYAETENQMEGLTNEINTLTEEESADDYLNLFERHAQNEILGFSILTTMPMLTVALKLPQLQEKLTAYPPVVQLGIAAFSLALQQEAAAEKFTYITGAETVEDAFPGNTQLHALHQKLFWVVKALHAMNNNDTEQIQRFHSLLTVTGIGGKLKNAYAIRFSQWLEKN